MSFSVALLRGGEGFIMDAARFQCHIWKEMEGPLYHVVIPMVGRFKRGGGIRHHI